MPDSSNARGICRTCRSGADCTLAASANQPVVQCEQFQMCDPLPTVAAKAGDGRRGRAAKEEPGADGMLGLCRTCADRVGCTFVRPESGVWHCEEYR